VKGGVYEYRIWITIYMHRYIHNSRLRQVSMSLFISGSAFLLIYFIFKLTGYEDLGKTLMGRLPLSLGYRTFCRFFGWEGGLLGALFFFSYISLNGDAGIPEAVKKMAPSGASGSSSSSSWTGVLGGILSNETTTEDTSSPSVNQAEYGRLPPANQVAPRGDEAGPSNQPPQEVSLQYHPDEVIGGDSIRSIERRLLSNKTFPSAHDIYMARINAEDLFEAKVEIIKLMAGLDPTGDWLGRGARALDNPRTATGEESFERLRAFLDDLNLSGKGSETFVKLKGRVFRRHESDAHSET